MNRTVLLVLGGAYVVLAVLQFTKGNWSFGTADLLIVGLALGWWFTLRQSDKDEAEYRRLRVHIEHKSDAPTRATIYYDDAPIFIGRDYSADIMRGNQ